MAQRRDIDPLMNEVEELFADLCQHRLTPGRTGFRPRVDVYRTTDPSALHIIVELAGVDPAEVELALADGVLVLTGQRRRPSAAGRRYEHIEIDYGPFQRRIALGQEFDADAAEARYEHGLLTIVLPEADRSAGPVRVRVTKGDEA